VTTQATESRSFFDVRTDARKVSLLPSQADPSAPSVDGLHRTTNLLVPDYLTSERFRHFPEDLYDLREHSHLVRFLRALMGDAGAGNMRKRYLIARFQQAFSSTHFYDLDRFYGAVFNTTRLQAEQLGINPFTDTATSDEWDRIHLSDAQFRERVLALAKAIPLGGTLPGLRTAAEAVVGAPCEVVENWRLVDYAHGHGFLTPDDYLGLSWAEIEAIGTYTDVENRGTYAAINGTTPPAVPNDRGSVIVRPLKTYLDTDAGNGLRAQDEQALRRVLNILKPAGVRLVVDLTGQGLYDSRDVFAMYADSEYYEVVQRVNPTNSFLAPTYPLSAGQVADGVTNQDDRPLPRPPFTASQGAAWSYANEVVAVRSYAENIAEQVIDGADFDRVTNFYGQVTEFSGEKGVLDPRQAEAGRLSSDTLLMSHPYAADRVEVLTHG
jgi:hypothetical protein